VSEGELYCKCYLDSEQDRTWLLDLLAQTTRGNVTGRTIESPDVIIDVSRNEDYDPIRKTVSDGFVYFRYYLDVTPAEGVTRAEYVASVGELLHALWSFGIDAVAACDFESELPRRNGGITRNPHE
jgi:hypothetical protein